MRGIALVAKMGSGKTTAADVLVEQEGFTRLALADPVKDGAVAALNRSLGYHRKRRGNPLTREELDANKEVFRPFLQWYGTEWGRRYLGDPEVWIKAFAKAAKAIAGPIVCDDCRFPNEAAALRRMGFVVVRLERDEVTRVRYLHQKIAAMGLEGQAAGDQLSAWLSHPSETEVDNIVADRVFRNDGGPQKLRLLAGFVGEREEAA